MSDLADLYLAGNQPHVLDEVADQPFLLVRLLSGGRGYRADVWRQLATDALVTFSSIQTSQFIWFPPGPPLISERILVTV